MQPWDDAQANCLLWLFRLTGLPFFLFLLPGGQEMLQRGEVEGALGHFLQVLHHARPDDRIVKPMVTLAAVASSGLTEFRVAWWAERPQARSAEEYRLGRVRGPRPALAPASQLGGAGGSALDWDPPGLGLGRVD